MVGMVQVRATPGAHKFVTGVLLFSVFSSLLFDHRTCAAMRHSLQKLNGFISPSSPLPKRHSRVNAAMAGIQPSGEIHIGNYIGCIHPALQYQRENTNLIFMVADLHATTGDKPAVVLKDTIRSTVATLLACGIDPERTSIFLQSDIPSILELNWLLGTVISLGRLRKLANFGRRKLSRASDNVGMCLYPLLMAADVLGSTCSTIIAGPDQMCHIGLIREVAEKLNRRVNEDILQLPSLYNSQGFRVLSLDGDGKMSKSSEKENTRVNLLDSDDSIAHKLRLAKTSTSIDTESPEVENLFRLYAFFSSKSFEEISAQKGYLQFSDLKNRLREAMSSHLEHIRRCYKEVIGNDGRISSVLAAGRLRVKPIFDSVVERVKERYHYHKN